MTFAKMPPQATKEQAERLGFVKPRTGGEGRKFSNLYLRGEYEAVSVAGPYGSQWWYRPVRKDHT
jgi:hypothetical protein